MTGYVILNPEYKGRTFKKIEGEKECSGCFFENCVDSCYEHITCNCVLNEILVEDGLPLGTVTIQKMIDEREDAVVNHPMHYTQGKIEVADFIDDQKLDYFEGNIVKYVCRHKLKNGVEDLKKARWYLDYLINSVVKSE